MSPTPQRDLLGSEAGDPLPRLLVAPVLSKRHCDELTYCGDAS